MSAKTQSARRASRRDSSLLEPDMTPELEEAIRQATNIVALRKCAGKFTRQLGLDISWNNMFRACLSFKVARKPEGWRPAAADVQEYQRQGAGIGPRPDMSQDEFFAGFRSALRFALYHQLAYWRRLPDAEGAGPDHVAPFNVLNCEPYDPWDIRWWEYDDQKAENVIAMAWKGNPIARAVLAEFIKEYRQEGAAPPPNLFRYIEDLAMGREPEKLGKQIGKTAQRDLDITILIHEVVRATGLQKSAQPAARRRPAPNACWIVQRALTNNGINLTLPAIRKALRTYNSLGEACVLDVMDYELVAVDGTVLMNLREAYRQADRAFAEQSSHSEFPQAQPVLQNS